MAHGNSIQKALETAPVASRPTGALASTDQQRAIAEVQAAMMIARANPRDPVRAIELIEQDCTRVGLAQAALYEYKRGGAAVVGPSIRLAECIAQRWGNIQFGIRELERNGKDSTVQAYAWDMENNVRREVTFSVPHVKDTKRGAIHLESTRDIYEMTANMGSRRVRACILGVIPGDVVESAVTQVERTLAEKAKVTPERIKKMLSIFAEYGVTQAMVEKRIQRRIDAITPALLLNLGKIANSLRDDMSSPADWFEVEKDKPSQNAEDTTAKLREKVKVRTTVGTESKDGADQGSSSKDDLLSEIDVLFESCGEKALNVACANAGTTRKGLNKNLSTDALIAIRNELRDGNEETAL